MYIYMYEYMYVYIYIMLVMLVEPCHKLPMILEGVHKRWYCWGWWISLLYEKCEKYGHRRKHHVDSH